MTAAFRRLTLVIASALGLFAVQSAKADHDHGRELERIDRLAQSVQAESRTLYNELRGAAYSSHELRSALGEVAQVYHLASRIHDASHGYASRRQMDRDVHSLKRLVHHVEEHLVGHRHFRRHIDRIDHMTHDLEDAIHDWADDDFYRDPVVSDPWYGPSYGSRPGVAVGPGGVSFGGRGFSFSFGR